MQKQDADSRQPSVFFMRFFYYLVAVILIIAVLNHQIELSFLGSMILGVVGAAKAWSRMSLKHLYVDIAIQSGRLFPGDMITVTMRVNNAKWLPIWIHVRAAIDNQLIPNGHDRYSSNDTWIGPYQKRTFDFQMPALRRGVYYIGPFHLQCGDLLGLSSRSKTRPERFRVIVYPRVKELKPVSLPRRDFFGVPGARHPVEDPIYLHGTQPYQHRRPSKFIHWKASARLNQLQEKLCEPSAQEKVLLTLDVARFEASDDAEIFEFMLEAIASMAVQLHRRGISVGLITNGRTLDEFPGIIQVGNGTGQLTKILETLAGLDIRARQEMDETLITGMGPAPGLSFAHFVKTDGEQTRKAEHILKHKKIAGVFYLIHPETKDESESTDMPCHYHLIKDICAVNE